MVIIEKEWLFINIEIVVKQVYILRILYKRLKYEKFILEFINGHKIYVMKNIWEENKLELPFKLRFDLTQIWKIKEHS